MKRIFLTALTVSLLLLGCGCKKEEKRKLVDFDLVAAADAIARTHEIDGGKRYSSAGDAKLDEDLIRSYFGDALEIPDFSKVDAYELYIDQTTPIKSCEYGIFKLNDRGYAETLVAFLRSRIDLKIENAKMYPSVDTSMLKSAVFHISGNYVWYCAVPNANEKIDAFLNAMRIGEQ